MDDINRYYEILGVKPGDSIDEIKQCYRDLVNIWHPDRFGNNPRLQRKAHEKLKEINRAYKELCSVIVEDNKRKSKDDLRYESRSDNKEDSTKEKEYHSNDEPDYAKHFDKTSHYIKEYWGIILIVVIICGSLLLKHTPKEPYSQKTYPISEYQRTSPKEKKVIPQEFSPQPFTSNKDSKFNKKQLPSVNIPSKPTNAIDISQFDPPKGISSSVNIPSEPTNFKGLSLGSSPFGKGIKNGNSMVTVDNGTKEDALVKLIRFRHIEEKIRNFYIPAGKKYIANKIPQGQYRLRIAFGKDWDNKLRKFNFNRHFSETEPFNISETKWTEDADDGIVERIRYSKMSITLHKVMHGNFKSQEISEEDFNN